MICSPGSPSSAAASNHEGLGRLGRRRLVLRPAIALRWWFEEFELVHLAQGRRPRSRLIVASETWNARAISASERPSSARA